MKVAVLGAGNVALASACWLAREGHEIHLWSAVEQERRILMATKGLVYEGIASGTASVVNAEEVGTAIDAARVIIIAAPAFAHETLMKAAAPYLTDDQYVVMHPVTGLSSLILSRLLKERGVRPTLIDLSTSLFTARKTSPTSVRLLRYKETVDMAVIPHDQAQQAMVQMQALFGDRFRLEPNALAISLNNHNPIYHVPPLLCNLSRADKQENWVIWDNITPSVVKFVRLADDERLRIVDYFGVTRVPVEQYFCNSFSIDGSELGAILLEVGEKLKGPMGPQTLDHRFFTEDVPFALVFYHSLGILAGIEMPITESLIRITSGLLERDFFAEGHTMERLGLDGKNRDEILRITMEGF